MASILADGMPIRLTGEDVERGTFSASPRRLSRRGDRRASTCRCSTLPQARAAFEIHNSPLSENAARRLRVRLQHPGAEPRWCCGKRQYGDFINGAQVILDEFLTSGRAKWGLAPSLVLLLPHGYEGPGPRSFERAARALPATPPPTPTCGSPTARPRRSTSTCCAGRRCCSTTDPLPLIVMTPKSLLRHPCAASTPRELAEGRSSR